VLVDTDVLIWHLRGYRQASQWIMDRRINPAAKSEGPAGALQSDA
jgi:hypothetical protein